MIGPMTTALDIFGVKYYKFSDPDKAIPSAEYLKESIAVYVKSRNIDPGYLDDQRPNYSKAIDDLLKTDFLLKPRTAREIAIEMITNYQVEISPSRISDILSRAPRKNLVVIEHAVAGNLNTYRLK